MFEPYIKPHGIGDLRFFYANQEAVNWYDPLKPYTLLEYEWVRENVHGYRIVDAGSHHGNYSIVFLNKFDVFEKTLYCIDCVKTNIHITEINIKLNAFHIKDYDECEKYTPEYNLYYHRLSSGKGFKSLSEAEPDIYKMDIEGSEFELMPQEIDDLPSVHTWIVEIHPNAGDPNAIAGTFAERGFELLKVDRERMIVRPYTLGERWLTHATLIARRGQ